MNPSPSTRANLTSHCGEPSLRVPRLPSTAVRGLRPVLGLVWLGLASSGIGALLVADFQFAGDLTSSTPGAPDLTFPATTGRGVSGSPSLTWGTGEAAFSTTTGFNLDVSGILAGFYDNYTVAVRVKIPDPGNWRGLVYASPPSGLTNTDDGFQTQPTGKLALWTNNHNNTVGNNGDISANTYFQATYSISQSAGTYTLASGLRANQDRTATFTESNVPEGFLLTDSAPRLVFFRDFYQDLTQGTVDRIQVYQGAMSVPEIAALDLTAPVPEPAGWTLLGGLVTALWVIRRRRA